MNNRFVTLDVFRGMFALMVVFYHLKSVNTSFLVNNSLVKGSYLFVDFFFVLSGFVIAYNYIERIKDAPSLGRYLKKRFLRLYPLHLFILLLFAGYVLMRNMTSQPMDAEQMTAYSTKGFYVSLLLLNSFPLPGNTVLQWNGPSWSISAEMVSYIFFGAVMLIFRRSSILLWVAVIAAACVALGSLDAMSLTFDNGWLRGLIGFSCGVITYHAYTRLKSPGKMLATFLEVGLLAASLALISAQYLFTQYRIFLDVVFMAVILVFAFQNGQLSQFINSMAPLRRLGELSYSIYMVHILVIVLLTIAWNKLVPKFTGAEHVQVVAVAAAVIVFSEFTYRFIEKRFQVRRPLKYAAQSPQ